MHVYMMTHIYRHLRWHVLIEPFNKEFVHPCNQHTNIYDLTNKPLKSLHICTLYTYRGSFEALS